MSAENITVDSTKEIVFILYASGYLLKPLRWYSTLCHFSHTDLHMHTYTHRRSTCIHIHPFTLQMHIHTYLCTYKYNYLHWHAGPTYIQTSQTLALTPKLTLSLMRIHTHTHTHVVSIFDSLLCKLRSQQKYFPQRSVIILVQSVL